MIPKALKPVALLALSCLVSSPALFAADQPVEITSPHFRLVTDAGEKQARHVLDNFERMRWMFQTLFPKTNVDPVEPIVIIAVKNRRAFQALEPADYLSRGQLNLAGLFLNTTDKNYVLLRLDTEEEHPFATVYHEYTHLMFRSASDWIPIWINEGIAEFYQNTDFHDKEVVLGQPSADDILYLRQNQIIPLATLFRVDHNSPYYHDENKGSVFYAESWALTHYLMVSDREKHTNRVSDYMTRMSHREDPVTAAQEAFGDLKQLQNALSSYIQQQQYKQFLLSSAAAPIDPASYKIHTLTQPQFDADRADFLAYVGRTQDARTLLDAVMKADAGNAQTRETMGFLESHAGDQEAARKWYGEAVELDPENFLTQYRYATLLAWDGTSEHSGEIESSLRAAIRLNPHFAPAYDRLAAELSRQPDKLNEAHLLNLQAVELDPTNVYYRLNAANVLMTQEKFDNAQQILHAAQTLAKKPEETAMISSRLGEIAAIRKAREAERAQAAAPGVVSFADASVSAAPANYKIVTVDTPPKHPVERATGPKHTVTGTLGKVYCAYPTYLELEVALTGQSRPVALYIPNFADIQLTALGFTAKSSMDPCHDFSGMKAKVTYAESSDNTIDGQLIAVELHK